MIRRIKKGRNYLAPSVLPVDLALEANFCTSLRFQMKVDELENMNDPENPLKGVDGEPLYFDS